jgi:agmatinase
MQLTAPTHSFLSSPVHTDLGTLEADFAVLGIPYGVPYNMAGVSSDAANAPTALRTRSQRFSKQLDHFDFDLDGTLFGDTDARLVDAGDLTGDPRDLKANAERATEAVRQVLARGCVPIVLGGDDSIPPLVVRAYEGHGPVNVIQVDAHLDYRDEVGGIRDGYSSPMRRIREMPWVGQIVQVGMRGVGSARPADVADARAAGNVIVPAETLHDRGIEWLLGQLEPDAPYFITLDVDGLDPSIAPGTSVPLPGGLNWSEAAALFRGIANRGSFVGIDIVEHFPSLDEGNRTSVTLARLLMNLMGTAARR